MTARLPRTLRLAPLAALLAAGGCTEARRGDVLLVTVDALRADHLGMYGYERPTSPHVDRWIGDGAIFDWAYSTAAHTSPAMTSMLSGLLPQEHRVRLIW